MTVLRRWPVCLGIALGCELCGCGRAALTVDEVIERNTQVVGGRTAIEAVNSIEVDGKYRATRPGRMRIDVMAGGKHGQAKEPLSRSVAESDRSTATWG